MPGKGLFGRLVGKVSKAAGQVARGEGPSGAAARAVSSQSVFNKKKRLPASGIAPTDITQDQQPQEKFNGALRRRKRREELIGRPGQLRGRSY